MSDEGYGPSAAYLRACDEQHVRELRALIADHDRTCAEGAECESCIAPRLARENLRLRAERDQHQRDAGQWWGELATANGEVLRLRAIADAADELVSCDARAEVESYGESAPGVQDAALAAAEAAYSTLARAIDAWRETERRSPTVTP